LHLTGKVLFGITENAAKLGKLAKSLTTNQKYKYNVEKTTNSKNEFKNCTTTELFVQHRSHKLPMPKS